MSAAMGREAQIDQQAALPRSLLRDTWIGARPRNAELSSLMLNRISRVSGWGSTILNLLSME